MASSTSSTATATMVTALRRFALRGLRKRGGVGGGCVASRAAILASQSSAVVKVGVGDAQGEAGGDAGGETGVPPDRERTPLKSRHTQKSYSLFCLKKKKNNMLTQTSVQAILTQRVCMPP